jgi:hypothetical protein
MTAVVRGRALSKALFLRWFLFRSCALVVIACNIRLAKRILEVKQFVSDSQEVHRY